MTTIVILYVNIPRSELAQHSNLLQLTEYILRDDLQTYSWLNDTHHRLILMLSFESLKLYWPTDVSIKAFPIVSLTAARPDICLSKHETEILVLTNTYRSTASAEKLLNVLWILCRATAKTVDRQFLRRHDLILTGLLYVRHASVSKPILVPEYCQCLKGTTCPTVKVWNTRLPSCFVVVSMNHKW
jgi:hypothetical protein